MDCITRARPDKVAIHHFVTFTLSHKANDIPTFSVHKRLNYLQVKMADFLSKVITFILALFGNTQQVPNTMSSGYVGKYRLTAVYDAKQESIFLPSPEYTFEITNDETTKSANDYSFGITLGNSMGGSFAVTPAEESDQSDAVKFSPLFSTAMMPPDDVFAVEMALSAALTDATSIELSDKNVITIGGEKGKIQGTKVE